MTDYKSGYDPKYGYNKNVFAHGTVGTAIMGQVIKVIATPIGLVSEAIQTRNSPKPRSMSDGEAAAIAKPPAASSKETDNDNLSPANESQAAREGPTYVEIPKEEARQLIASGKAEPADGETPTHELVSESDQMERDEADWALDDTVAEAENPEPSLTDENMQTPKPAQPWTKDHCTNSPFLSSFHSVAQALKLEALYAHMRPSSNRWEFPKTHFFGF